MARASKRSAEEPVATILIVEDEAPLAQILEINLKRNGFHTLIAQDGLTACRMAATHRPQAILLDILLPDLNGFDICAMVKGHQDPAIADIPVLMISALSSPEDISRGMNAGASAYMTKPYSVKEVIQCLSELLTEPLN